MHRPVEVKHAGPSQTIQNAPLIEFPGDRIETGLNSRKGSVHHIVVVQGNHGNVELGMPRSNQPLELRELSSLAGLSGDTRASEILNYGVNCRIPEIPQSLWPDLLLLGAKRHVR